MKPELRKVKNLAPGHIAEKWSLKFKVGLLELGFGSVSQDSILLLLMHVYHWDNKQL